MNGHQNLRCIVCGNRGESPFRIVYKLQDCIVVRCEACSFHFIPPRFRKNIDYTRYKTVDVAAEVARSDVWLKIQRNLLRYRLIGKYRKQGRIFDVGCGFGHFLLAGRQMGYRVSGVEMSKASVDYVRSRLGLDVEADDFLNVPENERYDVMTLWDVLEHTDDADRIVEKVSRMLRPEGFVFIQVPRVDSIIALLLKHRWWALGLDHVNYFSAKTIRLLLEKCGFEVIEIKSSIELKNVLLYVLLPKFRKKRGRPALTAADRQREFNKITSKRMWLRKALVAVHNAVYRSLGFLRIGDEMIVVAQKR